MKSNKSHYLLRCTSCNTVLSEKETYTTCMKCNRSVEIEYDYELIRERLNIQTFRSEKIKASKYLDFYPIIQRKKIVTLDEGGTPLYKCNNLGKRLNLTKIYVKYEGANPTGAFKDRGTMIELTKASEMGSKAICVASTGNMAASVSAYSAKVNIPCYVLVPEGCPIGKLSQTLSYGGRVLQIKGTYNDAADLAVRLSKHYGYYLSGDYCFRMEGQKSCGFEIVEQMNWETPKKVIVPMGFGTNISAIWKGFTEFHQLGLINSIPEMIGVQASDCSPIVSAFRSNKEIEPIMKPQTVASAIAVGSPLDGPKALDVINKSNGDGLTVTDDEIVEAQLLLARTESIFVEPAAAAVIAALIKMREENKVERDEEIVCILTGNGLKDSAATLKNLAYPPSVKPSFNEVTHFIDKKLYNIKAPLTKNEKEKIIFTSVPKLYELENVIKTIFDIDLTRDDLRIIGRKVQNFISKGKKVTHVDLNLILEETLTAVRMENRILEINDFDIESSKTKPPKCRIKMNYRGNEIIEEGTGVGPVDAAISAITRALEKRGTLKFQLTDYQVQITSRGTDATVDVKMSLIGKEGNTSIGMGTSPDIIEASIMAFEDAYNALHI